MDESTEYMSGRVPASLKRKVKARASLRGLNLAEALQEGMAAWLGESEEIGGPPPLSPELMELQEILTERSQAAEHARALIKLAVEQYRVTKEREAGARRKVRESGT